MNTPKAYTEIKKIDQNPHEHSVNDALSKGWLLIGIEQKREIQKDGSFEDETTYILGKKVED